MQINSMDKKNNYFYIKDNTHPLHNFIFFSKNFLSACILALAIISLSAGIRTTADTFYCSAHEVNTLDDLSTCTSSGKALVGFFSTTRISFTILTAIFSIFLFSNAEGTIIGLDNNSTKNKWHVIIEFFEYEGWLGYILFITFLINASLGTIIYNPSYNEEVLSFKVPSILRNGITINIIIALFIVLLLINLHSEMQKKDENDQSSKPKQQNKLISRIFGIILFLSYIYALIILMLSQFSDMSYLSIILCIVCFIRGMHLTKQIVHRPKNSSIKFPLRLMISFFDLTMMFSYSNVTYLTGGWFTAFIVIVLLAVPIFGLIYFIVSGDFKDFFEYVVSFNITQFFKTNEGITDFLNVSICIGGTITFLNLYHSVVDRPTSFEKIDILWGSQIFNDPTLINNLTLFTESTDNGNFMWFLVLIFNSEINIPLIIIFCIIVFGLRFDRALADSKNLKIGILIFSALIGFSALRIDLVSDKLLSEIDLDFAIMAEHDSRDHISYTSEQIMMILTMFILTFMFNPDYETRHVGTPKYTRLEESDLEKTTNDLKPSTEDTKKEKIEIALFPTNLIVWIFSYFCLVGILQSIRHDWAFVEMKKFTYNNVLLEDLPFKTPSTSSLTCPVNGVPEEERIYINSTKKVTDEFITFRNSNPLLVEKTRINTFDLAIRILIMLSPLFSVIFIIFQSYLPITLSQNMFIHGFLSIVLIFNFSFILTGSFISQHRSLHIPILFMDAFRTKYFVIALLTVISCITVIALDSIDYYATLSQPLQNID